MVVANIFPTFYGVIFFGCKHPWVIVCWVSMRLQETYLAHSGYCFVNTWFDFFGLAHAVCDNHMFAVFMLVCDACVSCKYAVAMNFNPILIPISCPSPPRYVRRHSGRSNFPRPPPHVQSRQLRLHAARPPLRYHGPLRCARVS